MRRLHQVEKLGSESEHDRWLNVCANMIRTIQYGEATRLRRGWSNALKNTDNLVRSRMQFSVYQDDGPVTDFIWWVQDKTELADVRLEAVSERFGIESRDRLSGIMHEHLASHMMDPNLLEISATLPGLAKYVPPVEYTYAMLRLDDHPLVELPLYE